VPVVNTRGCGLSVDGAIPTLAEFIEGENEISPAVVDNACKGIKTFANGFPKGVEGIAIGGKTVGREKVGTAGFHLHRGAVHTTFGVGGRDGVHTDFGHVIPRHLLLVVPDKKYGIIVVVFGSVKCWFEGQDMLAQQLGRSIAKNRRLHFDRWQRVVGFTTSVEIGQMPRHFFVNDANKTGAAIVPLQMIDGGVGNGEGNRLALAKEYRV
jgi:hypothetical protein